MKILLLDPADFFGGAEYFTIDILDELSQKKDVQVRLLTTGKSEKYKNLIPSNVHIQEMNLPRLRPFRPFALWKTLRKIKKEIEHFQPDVLHSNSVRAGIFCSFFPEKWTHFSHDFTTPQWLVKRFGKAQKIFSCSQVVKKDLEKKGIPAQKIKVIPNGISVGNARERSSIRTGHDQSLQKIIISLIGRIDTWKGQDIFVQAAELLQKDLPDVGFRIYGKSSEHDKKTIEYEKKLRDFVEEKKLKNVYFCGQEKREKIFTETDIVIHASTQPEPFGRTVLEALAHGIPVLASDNGGVREILAGRDFKEFRVEPKNPRELAKKILFLTRNTALQEKFKTLAAQRVHAFNLEKITNEMEKEWKKI